MATRKPAKPAAPKAAPPKPAVQAPEPRKAAAEKPSPPISAHERERLVAEAAYYRAQRRGFTPGYELQDWVEAEAEVNRLIGKSP
jgi:hypothetical protein